MISERNLFSRLMLTFLCAIFVVGIILMVSKLRRANLSTEKCAYVVVLGDLGRSPRMCNHAIQFAKHKFNVQLIGYTGKRSQILSQAKENDFI